MTFFLGNLYLEAHNDFPALVPGRGCLGTHVYDLCFSGAYGMFIILKFKDGFNSSTFTSFIFIFKI